jgi:hypothetical protein
LAAFRIAYTSSVNYRKKRKTHKLWVKFNKMYSKHLLNISSPEKDDLEIMEEYYQKYPEARPIISGRKWYPLAGRERVPETTEKYRPPHLRGVEGVLQDRPIPGPVFGPLRAENLPRLTYRDYVVSVTAPSSGSERTRLIDYAVDNLCDPEGVRLKLGTSKRFKDYQKAFKDAPDGFYRVKCMSVTDMFVYRLNNVNYSFDWGGPLMDHNFLFNRGVIPPGFTKETWDIWRSYRHWTNPVKTRIILIQFPKKHLIHGIIARELEVESLPPVAIVDGELYRRIPPSMSWRQWEPLVDSWAVKNNIPAETIERLGLKTISINQRLR